MLLDGLGAKVNEEGISFYSNIIDTLLEKGMKQFDFLPVAPVIHVKQIGCCRYSALCNIVPLGSSFASSRVNGWVVKQGNSVSIMQSIFCHFKHFDIK